jgi:hypothetical protein
VLELLNINVKSVSLEEGTSPVCHSIGEDDMITTVDSITFWHVKMESLHRVSFGQYGKLLFTLVAGKHILKSRRKSQKDAKYVHRG